MTNRKTVIKLLGLLMCFSFNCKADYYSPVQYDYAEECCVEPKNWYIVDTFSVGKRNHIDFANPGERGLTARTYHKTLFGDALGFGRFFGAFRLEAEASYRQNYLRHVRTSDGQILVTGESLKFGNLSFMGNGYWDLHICNCLTWYFGGGIGASLVYGPTIDDGSMNTKNANIDYKRQDTVFAWQLLTGVTAPINDCFDIVFGYRFFATCKPVILTLTDAGNEGIPGNGATGRGKANNVPYMQMVEIGLRFKF